jgi:uncharacterized protein YbjT (DUF2867 family)
VIRDGGGRSRARARAQRLPVPAHRPAEVAAEFAGGLALSPAPGRVPDIGGPDVTTWAEMIRRYLAITGRKRVVTEVWMPAMKEIRAS